MKRKIVLIDQEKCNGCGLCVKACHEGAIQVLNGKARLVSDIYCDGLGACLDKCPQDAITIEEREAVPFSAEAVEKRQAPTTPGPKPASGCPGMRAFAISKGAASAVAAGAGTATPSQLQQWPVQLHLVPVQAPYWEDADLLVCADCVPFAYADFHRDLLRGKKVITACPKLDETSGYAEKLAAILTQNRIRSVTVAHMEVPCCLGLVRLAAAALSQCGKAIPFETVKVGIRGQVLERQGSPVLSKAN